MSRGLHRKLIAVLAAQTGRARPFNCAAVPVLRRYALIWPSVGPLIQGNERVVVTAAQSLFRLMTKPRKPGSPLAGEVSALPDNQPAAAETDLKQAGQVWCCAGVRRSVRMSPPLRRKESVRATGELVAAARSAYGGLYSIHFSPALSCSIAPIILSVSF